MGSREEGMIAVNLATHEWGEGSYEHSGSVYSGSVYSVSCKRCGVRNTHLKAAEPCPGKYPVPGPSQLSTEQWNREREAREDADQCPWCPCDGHPIDQCETCRGACSCHWTQASKE